MFLSRYLKAYPSRLEPDHILLFSTLRNSTALVPAPTYRAALRGELTGPEEQTLQRLGMLVNDLDQEREQLRGILERVSQRSRRYDAVVILNLDCNLDCPYCYEGSLRGDRYMSDKTARLVVERLKERIEGGKDLAVAFYGGEPLLSERLIREISLPLQEAALQKQVRYDFSLVTNGTLLSRETALRLAPLGLKGAKVTLDGPSEIHNRQRPFASGSGSFDTVVDNIAQVWDLLALQVGGNYYQDNYRSFPQLLDQLMERGITPEKIALVQFAPVVQKSGCAEYGSGCACSSDPWLIEASIFLREETMRRGFVTTKPSFAACVVEHPGNIVINYDGSLYKCPGFMGWDGFCIGSLAEGETDYGKTHGIGSWQNDTCLDCSYLPICFGGCRYMNLLQGKPMSEVDCRLEFLDATLESFILQNIAYPAQTR